MIFRTVILLLTVTTDAFNPFTRKSHSLDRDTIVRCFDTYAFHSSNGSKDWTAQIRCAAVYNDDADDSNRELDTMKKAVNKIRGIFSKRKEDIAEESRFTQTTSLFRHSPIKDKDISIQFIDAVQGNSSVGTQQLLGRTGKNGEVEKELTIPSAAIALNVDKKVAAQFDVIYSEGVGRTASGRILISLNPRFGVFTDIDDTIKITQVLSLKKMFRNAFKEEYKPVPGMPELFRRIHDLFPNVTRELHKRANNNHQHHRNPTRSHKKKHKKKKSATRSLPPSNATAVSNATTQQISLRPLTQKQQTPLFYYVSGTPWQLTDVLSHFIDQYYPMGEFMLQKFRFSIGSLIRLSNIRKYKTGRFDLIHKRFPELRWYLIGDSGQLDPEIYAEIYKRYPDRIICIWIVKTQGTDEKKERKQNSDSRFQKVFKEVPSDKWNAFHEPATIMQLPEGKCR